MSTEQQRAAPKRGISRLQLVLLALQLLVLVGLSASLLLSKWERDERRKRIDRLEFEIKQMQKAVDERQKRGGEKQPRPAKAKPDAAGNKASQLHRLDWPEGRLVDDRLAVPAVSWTASVLA